MSCVIFDPRFSIYDDADTLESALIYDLPTPPPKGKSPSELARLDKMRVLGTPRKKCLDCDLLLTPGTAKKRCTTCAAIAAIALKERRRASAAIYNKLRRERRSTEASRYAGWG